MTTIFHAWPYVEQLHRMHQGSNFMGGSFRSQDNVKVPIKFTRESES